MENIPGKIHLMIDDYSEDIKDFNDLYTEHIFWCEGVGDIKDIKYILESKYKELEKQNEELLKIVMESCKSDYDSLTSEAFKDWYKDEIKILEEIKQKPIEEILKEM